MKRLRFICFASLLAIIFALGGISDAGPTTSAVADEDKPPLSSSANITITMITPPLPDD